MSEQVDVHYRLMLMDTVTIVAVTLHLQRFGQLILNIYLLLCDFLNNFLKGALCKTKR